MRKEEIYIHRNDSIGIIQAKFSELFPVLWIKIFKHAELGNNESGENILFCPEVCMSEINPDFHDGIVTLRGSMRVSDLEQEFYDRFGLFVQISLKNGNTLNDSCRLDDYLSRKLNTLETTIRRANPEMIYFRNVPFGC